MMESFFGKGAPKINGTRNPFPRSLADERVIVIVSCTALALVACVTTDVESVWKDETRTEKLDKVFVLAVVKNPAYRDSIEYGIDGVLLPRLVDRKVETVYVGGPSYYDGFYGNRYRGG